MVLASREFICGGITISKHRHKTSGFTLIELMIVIAIIGILSAVAIPAYQDYITRAQMSEPLSLMSGMKAGLSEWYANQGSWPTLGVDIIVTTTGRYTSSIVILGTTTAVPGTITLQALMKSTGVNANIISKTVELRSVDGGSSWSCTQGGGASAVSVLYLPGACR